MTLAQVMALYESDPEIAAAKPKEELGTVEDLMILSQMQFGE